MFKPKILKRVTVPVLKMVNNRPYYLKFLDAAHIGKEIQNSPIKSKEPATVVTCFDFRSQENVQVICRTVMMKELLENYPGDSYVGKSFEIIMQNHSDTKKRYKLFTISEIAEPSPEDFDPTDFEPVNEVMSDDDHDDPQDSQDDIGYHEGSTVDRETGEIIADDLGASEPKKGKTKNGKRTSEVF